MPNENKLTPIQKDALTEMLIAAKRFFFAPLGSKEEKAAAKAVIEKADAASAAFDER